MRKISVYLAALAAGCILFVIGMQCGMHRTGNKTTVEKESAGASYSLFEHDELFDALLQADRHKPWDTATVNKLLDLYRQVNANVQIEDYPAYIRQVRNDFGENTGETNVDYDMFNAAMHGFKRLYINHLYNRLNTSEAQTKMKEVLSAFEQWEKTLIGLYSNNTLLGSCAHRWYTIECAAITDTALDNLSYLLYWLDYTNREKEPEEYDFMDTRRLYRIAHYYDYLQITEDRLKKVVEYSDVPPTYQPMFESERNPGERLTPAHGQRVMEEEKKAWASLKKALDAYARAIGYTVDAEYDKLHEQMAVARLNAFWPVASILILESDSDEE